MGASASSKSLMRGRPGTPFLVTMAAAASMAVLIALASAQSYPAAIIVVLLWATVAAVAVIGSMDEAARSRVAATIMVVWFVTTPVAWFFVRFPLEKSLVTYERLVFALVGLFAVSRVLGGGQGSVVSGRGSVGNTAIARAGTGSDRITIFEAVWFLLALLACFSALAASSSTGYALRTAVDAFVLPLVAFYGARTYLKSREHRRFLVVAAMLLGLLLLGTGAFEFLTGINLLPYTGSEIIREGEPRVNGPFITDTSFAVVSLMLVLFLRSAPRMFDVGFDAGARLLYRLGIVAAMLACLLPLFRAVAVALAVCWAAEDVLTALPKRQAGPDTKGPDKSTGDAQEEVAARGQSGLQPSRLRSLLRNTWGRRLRRPENGPYGLFHFFGGRQRRHHSLLRVAVVSILVAGAVMVLAPRNIKDRLVSPRNAYGRLLSWRLAANMIYRHPVFGVGLANYVDYFNQEYTGGRSALELELDTHIVRHPHSNLVWIAAELGLVGLALYVAANILLLIPACRALRPGRQGRARAAGACFIVLLAAYWIPGLELTSGMYSELNLYFFFLLGLIFPLLSPEGQPKAHASD